MTKTMKRFQDPIKDSAPTSASDHPFENVPDENVPDENLADVSPAANHITVTPQSSAEDENSVKLTANCDKKPREFKFRQFLLGVVLAISGMGLMIFVAAGTLHDVGGSGAVSLPATGLCMILGLMMLGGGFGQIAVSTSQTDDSEFRRLLAGEPIDDGPVDTV